jgi:hypothetical protein
MVPVFSPRAVSSFLQSRNLLRLFPVYGDGVGWHDLHIIHYIRRDTYNCVSIQPAMSQFRHNVLMGTGEESILQGDYGETWLRVVAAGSDLLHGRPTTVDLEKADVELVRRGPWNGAGFR